MFLDTSHFSISSTFSFCISTPFGLITTPRNSTSLTFHLHFSCFTNRSFSSNLFNTSSTSSSYSSSVFVVTSMSSMNVAVFPWFIISQNKSFIIIWKVVGELVKPKYMTVSSYTLICVVNMAFHLSPSFILTLLYPHLRSSFVNTFFLPYPIYQQ